MNRRCVSICLISLFLLVQTISVYAGPIRDAFGDSILIYFNPQKKDIDLILTKPSDGISVELSVNKVRNKEMRIYTFEDNTYDKVVLVLEVLRNEHTEVVTVVNITYNSAVLSLDKNVMVLAWSGHDDLATLNQIARIGKLNTIAVYNAGQNVTKIVDGEEIIEVSGLWLLKLEISIDFYKNEADLSVLKEEYVG